MEKNSEKSFETALKELEEIVEMLEKGELSLDDSIEAFQKGMELSQYCNKRLDAAEKKISILLEDEKGNIKEEPFLAEKAAEEQNEF